MKGKGRDNEGMGREGNYYKDLKTQESSKGGREIERVRGSVNTAKDMQINSDCNGDGGGDGEERGERDSTNDCDAVTVKGKR